MAASTGPAMDSQSSFVELPIRELWMAAAVCSAITQILSDREQQFRLLVWPQCGNSVLTSPRAFRPGTRSDKDRCAVCASFPGGGGLARRRVHMLHSFSEPKSSSCPARQATGAKG